MEEIVKDNIEHEQFEKTLQKVSRTHSYKYSFIIISEKTGKIPKKSLNSMLFSYIKEKVTKMS